GMVLNGAPLELRRRAQDDIVRWLKEENREEKREEQRTGKGDGRMRHTVSAVFPLSRTADAHQAVEAGGKRGTVVVKWGLALQKDKNRRRGAVVRVLPGLRALAAAYCPESGKSETEEGERSRSGGDARSLS